MSTINSTAVSNVVETNTTPNSTSAAAKLTTADQAMKDLINQAKAGLIAVKNTVAALPNA